METYRHHFVSNISQNGSQSKVIADVKTSLSVLACRLQTLCHQVYTVRQHWRKKNYNNRCIKCKIYFVDQLLLQQKWVSLHIVVQAQN